MKKNVIAVLALSLFLMAGPASASIIGLFGDLDATTCTKTVNTAYVYVEVYFCALLDDTPAISACEFGATGITMAGFAVTPTVTWDTPLVIGSILTPEGVALAFPTPKQAPLAYLGTISWFVLAAFPANSVMQIVPSEAGNLVVVDAETAVILPAQGWRLIANCQVGGEYGDCLCEGTIATSEAAWGQIKALY
jgi:hypothetical protein